MATTPTPAPTQAADPAVVARMHRRRRGRQLRLAAALAVVLASFSYVAWRVGRQMVATTLLMYDRVEVDWTNTPDNWYRGGATQVFSFARSRYEVEDQAAPNLKLLSWLFRVETLDLSEIPGLRDEDLASLDRLPDLVMVRLDRPSNLPAALAAKQPRLTDATLARLRGMTRLADLSMAGQQVTDAGLEHLTGLDHLASINLEGNDITDSGLEPLKRLKGLTSVVLVGTKVTPKAAHAFEVARPGVSIVVGVGDPN